MLYQWCWYLQWSCHQKNKSKAEASQEWMSVQEWQEKLMDKLNLNGLSEWSPHNTAIVRELLFSYHNIFALEPNELGCTSAIEHEICINDDEPFKEHFRHIPLPLLEEVHASLRDMLEAGTIWPSQSPWCNAVVLVQKKDGSLWFCIDFRCLNAWTKKDSYPLPRIQEVLESMAGAAHFSTMDFKSGFWQVCMAPESQQYTAFMVGNLGFYEFTRMPFGLCNAPVTFPAFDAEYTGRAQSDLLHHLSRWCDRLWAYRRRTPQEHLWVVFECFREFNLKLKPSKCSFFQTGDSVPCTSCLQQRNSPKWGECAHHHGVSHARDLHRSKSILWIGRSLLLLHQKLCTFGACTVWYTGWWS